MQGSGEPGGSGPDRDRRVSRRVVVLGALVVVALALVVNPLYLYQYPDEVNTLQRGNPFDSEPRATVDLDALPAESRGMVSQALERGRYEFHGDHRRPARFRFEYRGAPPVYAIEHGGRVTNLTTYGQSELVGTEGRRSAALQAYGLVLGLVAGAYALGLRWRGGDSPRLAAGLAGVGAVFLLLNAGFRYGASAIGVFGMVGSSPVVGLGTVLALLPAAVLVVRRGRTLRRWLA